VYARLWSYVTHAVRECSPEGAQLGPPAGKPDGRSKVWSVQLRFSDGTGQLTAETEPEPITGTGQLPALVAAYGAEVHADDDVSNVIADAIKAHLLEAVAEKLPQLRNNLGRSKEGKATMRIEYSVGEHDYVCEVAVSKP
jgi:hypothetical protein